MKEYKYSKNDIKCGRKKEKYTKYALRRKINKKYRQNYLHITIPCFLLIFFLLTSYFQTDSLEINTEITHHRQLSSCEEEVAEEEESGRLFPKDIFSHQQLKSGAIIFHILCMCYMFMGLAIICDDYFEPSLEALCESLDLTEDVAGATFMAAGGSAPELATSIVGVFFAQSDIGFGTIVGSAVFNVLFVIAICAWVAPGLELSWWPLVRDCCYYCTSILVLVLCVLSQDVNIKEAILLFIFYLIYVLIMKFNEQLYTYVSTNIRKPVPSSCPRRLIRTICASLPFRILINSIIFFNLVAIILEVKASEGSDASLLWREVNFACSMVFLAEYILKSIGVGFLKYWTDSWNAIDGGLVLFIIAEILIGSSATSSVFSTIRLFRFIRMSRFIRVVRIYEAFTVKKETRATQTRDKEFPEPWLGWDHPERKKFLENMEKNKKKEKVRVTVIRLNKSNAKKMNGISIVPSFNDTESDIPLPAKRKQSGARCSVMHEEDEEDSEDGGPDGLFDIPGGVGGKIYWFISFLLRFLFKFTIMDTTQKDYKKYWYQSFTACVLWIGFLSYIMVWMSTVLGDTFGIPDPVMGLTLLAAGTSIPDLLSSAAVARRGLGDMAVSSSIGSNIFDILVGLPVPWMIYCGMHYPDTIPIKSDGLTIMVLSLFLMVAFVFLLIHFYGWVLNKRLSYSFVSLYFGFVTLSLLLEYGVIFKAC